MPSLIIDGKIQNLSIQEYNKMVASLRAELKLNEDGTIKGDIVPDLDVVYIQGQKFTGIGYQGLQTVNTKTYVEEPTRGNDGSIANINEYDTFVVPRCKLNLKYLSLEDYERLSQAILSNEFTVEYYDKRFRKRVTHKMYAEPEELTKFYNVDTKVIGLIDYEVSFIGTLNDLEEYTLVYDSSGGNLISYVGEYNSTTEYKKGDRVSLDNDYYEAIWYEDKFTNKDLTDTTYWQNVPFSEFSLSATYKKDDVVYKQEDTSRAWYKAIYDGSFTNRELTNTTYWQLIKVIKFDIDETYQKGQYVINSDGSNLYLAIYYNDEFSGVDPTITTYWKILPVYNGEKVKWGNSVVIETIENLFEAPSGNVHFIGWKTENDMWYYPNQSANIFSNLRLIAQWE